MSVNILIVEDERDLLTVLDYNLKREGYQTRTAATGRAALEAIARDAEPAAVLTPALLMLWERRKAKKAARRASGRRSWLRRLVSRGGTPSHAGVENASVLIRAADR